METKEYYTPTIEEIYSGYEYEVKDRNDEWRKVNEFSNDYDYEDNPHYAIMKDINIGNIRVPYLCKQDIVDLGWEHKQYVKDGELVYNFVKGEWYLEYWVGKIPYVEIGREEYDMGYAGNCKSKNELFKLMKDYLNIHI